MKELKSFLVKQKYPENTINMGIDRAMNLARTIVKQRMGSIRQNKHPTTDFFDRMFIISTSFGHIMTFFKTRYS